MPASDKWFEEFCEQCKIVISESSDEIVVFDLIGVDASIANALRRVLLAEVPAMAPEHIYISQNTGIMQDEVLAHRIGQIPIKADPKCFEIRPYPDPSAEFANENNTLVFKLSAKAPSTLPLQENDEEFSNCALKVTSKDFIWEPMGSQAEKFEEMPPKVVYDDILITKLAPNQEIELEAHITVGVGRDHAKFQPVSTASYRLLPDITFNEEITGEDAKTLVSKCPMGVFDIEDMAAIVKNPRQCTVCRECIREPEWRPKINLSRKRDHFIFSVESVGQLPAPRIVKDALEILKKKCDDVNAGLERAMHKVDEVVESSF
eukprot:TRINITY_DN2750_c0_g1_i2.p1 TRINITY_DN2750_c0_g1~~TRINITY_DN2750_c0_g1_i2.p1  ORF type:complete len:319 (-),score=108.02 TRINITY_DN2750_c0_g1_i2:133-1089(-)